MSAALRVVVAGARAGVDVSGLARRAGGPERLLAASPRALAGMGVPPALASELAAARRTDERALREELRAGGVEVICQDEPGYPQRLEQLPEPPLALFGRNAADTLTGEHVGALAVVGSRRASDEGLRRARRLARFVAARGALVVSGLAIGIDAAAHAGALEAGGRTLALLGCGPDVVYPRTNAALFERVRHGGGVLSEYPPGTPAAPWRFPARNRLIACLADAVLVVEAQARSGALITADRALDLGRDVFAVPGSPASAGAAGTNALLKAGAALVEDEHDLAALLGLDAPARGGPEPAGLAGTVLEAVRRQAAFSDELARTLAHPAGEVAGALALLELEGLLAHDAAGRWVATSRAGGPM